MGDSQANPVLILTGPPGSGKTTVAGLLAAGGERAVHVECDRFFQFIRAGYVEPWRPESHEQNRTVMRIVANAAAAYACAGYFTILDGIVLPAWSLQPVRDSLHAAGHRVAYAVLRAPAAVCLARAAGRTRQPFSSQAVIERLWHDFAGLGPLEAHAIDTAGRTAEETVRLLGERLRDPSDPLLLRRAATSPGFERPSVTHEPG